MEPTVNADPLVLIECYVFLMKQINMQNKDFFFYEKDSVVDTSE